LAKKPRTPDPPRKVQAPKVRQKQPSGNGGGFYVSRTNLLSGVGLVVIAALVAALVVLNGRGGGGANVSSADVKEVRAAMTAAGCTFDERPASPAQQHMSSDNQKVTYATFPASSGIHSSTPAIWNNYRVSAADPRQVVHDLEHGGIAIWYGAGISAAARGALDAFYEKSPDGIIITPIADRYPNVTYPKHDPIRNRIALSVWTVNTDTRKGTVYIAVCPRFDEKAFSTFRDAFRGKGPERFPVSSLKPGT